MAEVAVNRKTGEIKVERVCIAHDCGLVVNPDGTINQIEGGTIQTVSRTLMEAVRWDKREVLSRDWASYPILRHDQVPKVLVDLIDQPGQPSFGAGEPTACSIPAAIANAVFDATGARLRAVPDGARSRRINRRTASRPSRPRSRRPATSSRSRWSCAGRRWSPCAAAR